jgi:carboxymethylenebutenolidase
MTQPDGFLAAPSTGKGSPVLVLHPWWGLNDTIKAFCKRLAEAGFIVFAPDLYHGKITDQISEAERLVGELDAKSDQAKAEISEAVKFLKERAGADSIAVVGFSLGAFYAVDLSVREPDSIRSVVIFYGTGYADFSQAKADYLGHFAAADPYEPLEGVEQFEADLKASGRSATFYTYPDTGHWFFESDRADAYNAAAATLAWDRTLAFLRE